MHFTYYSMFFGLFFTTRFESVNGFHACPPTELLKKDTFHTLVFS